MIPFRVVVIGIGFNVPFDHFEIMIAEVPTVIEIFLPSSIKAFNLSI